MLGKQKIRSWEEHHATSQIPAHRRCGRRRCVCEHASPPQPSRNRCPNSNGASRRASPSRSTRCTARARTFAKYIGEMTDNKFQIRIFAAGEIVPGLQVLDAVQNGTVEMGHSAGTYYVGKDPTLAFDTALPFGMNARQQEAWILGRRTGAAERSLQGLQHLRAARAATPAPRWAAGSARRSRRPTT